MASSHRPRPSPPQTQASRAEPGNEPINPRLSGTTVDAGKAAKLLLSFGELPEWYQDNHFIRHSYRPVSGSARVSFRSWSYIHNESVNIFSHLIPAIVFLLGEWYIVYSLSRGYSDITGTDYFIFTFFLATAILSLGLSATYHTLMNHSFQANQLWLRFDHVGIVILTLGDFVSGIYMVFWCEPLERKIYWSMIGVLGALAIFITSSPFFQGPRFRVYRALAFVGVGLSGFAPLIHGIQMFGFSQMVKQSGLPYYLAEGGFLLLGTLIYVARFPERWFPGRFDIYGSSHQLFHVLVVFATVTQLVGILEAFDYNYANRTCRSL